ncbi:TSUP family transporter [bacterium]|nr:TSUP family transporter [bacterium]
MTILPFIFLGCAGFFAGLIDSIAGGGGLISLPALLAIGTTPHIALGINKFQGMVGASASLFNYARKKHVLWKIAAVGIPFSLIGSVIGAKIALFVEATLLAKILVALLPPAAIFVLCSRTFIKTCAESHVHRLNLLVITPLVCLTIGAYDGFFGPGTGTLLIIVLVLFSRVSLMNATATAKTFNAASNIGAFATFIISGKIFYPYAIVMGLGNVMGALIGSHLAMKHGQKLRNL